MISGSVSSYFGLQQLWAFKGLRTEFLLGKKEYDLVRGSVGFRGFSSINLKLIIMYAIILF